MFENFSVVLIIVNRNAHESQNDYGKNKKICFQQDTLFHSAPFPAEILVFPALAHAYGRCAVAMSKFGCRRILDTHHNLTYFLTTPILFAYTIFFFCAPALDFSCIYRISFRSWQSRSNVAILFWRLIKYPTSVRVCAFRISPNTASIRPAGKIPPLTAKNF